MPKNKKKQDMELQGQGAEGRPPALTLACFIKHDNRTKSKLGPKATDSHSELQNDKAPYSVSSISSREENLLREANLGSVINNSQLSGAIGGIGLEQTTEERVRSIDGIKMNDNKVEETAGFKIMRTKKGGYPIYLEKRAKGKKVTVVRQVTGNCKLLLQQMKTKFGTGGITKSDEVEIQGDFESKVLKYLQDNSSFMMPYNPKQSQCS